MKTNWRRIANLILGVLLLITLSYAIPSSPRQRNISQTEWIKRAPEKASNNVKDYSKPIHPASFNYDEFAFKILVFNNKTQVEFRLRKSFPFSYRPIKFAEGKHISDDDDYLFL